MIRSARVVSAAFAALAAAASLAFAGEWLDEVEITLDEPTVDQQIVNVRIAPTKTFDYDQLRFECVYRQELPTKDASGKSKVKVVEPVTFVYRRQDARLVQELDFYCSFRAPYGLDKLVETYGKGVFGPDAPVVIDRIKIAGIKDGAPLWQEVLKAPGLHKIADAKGKPAPVRKPPKKAAFGDIDLD